MATDIDARLARWVERHLGADSAIEAISPMPGNAGISYRVDVTGGRAPRSLVIRLSPPGVPRSGSTDVVRQAPLLHVLGRSGVPIARVEYAAYDDQDVGTDVLVQEFVTGLPLHMTSAENSAEFSTQDDVEKMVLAAVDVLAGIHAIGVPPELATWSTVRSVSDEIDFWARFIERLPDAEWVALAHRLREALLASEPATVQTGLLHGDFQTNNVLYDSQASVSAVVDWELAGFGAQMLDVGWLMMFCDASSWSTTYRDTLRVVMNPDDIVRRYSLASATEARDAGWYQALATYRFGVIGAWNFRLHQTGARPDSAYELLAPSLSTLFNSGLRLVEG